jgi:hypothetical protein
MQMTLSFGGDINVPVARSSRIERTRGVRPVARTGREHAVMLVDRPAPAMRVTPIIRAVPMSPQVDSGAMEEEPERWDGLY